MYSVFCINLICNLCKICLSTCFKNARMIIPEDVEGCVCEEGMLLEGDTCVAPDQCGCLTEDTQQIFPVNI